MRFSFIWVFLFFFILFGIFNVAKTERAALAGSIKSGHLVTTPDAERMIKIGDGMLHKATTQKELYMAFIAEVWFERARLEMEMSR